MTPTAGELEIVAAVAAAGAAALIAARLAARSSYQVGRPRTIVAIAIAIAFTTYTALALAKLAAYNMGAEDLGRVDQAIWSVLDGRPLVFSASEIGRSMSRMAGHVELLFVPLAPLFLLADAVAAIIVAQSLIAVLGAIPAFRLGRAIGGDGLGVSAAIAYLAHPGLGYAVLSDVHGDTLSMPFLLLAIERAWVGRRSHSFAAMVLAVAGKEYVAALAVATGVWIALARRDRRLGAAFVALGLVWVLVVVPLAHDRYRPADFPQLTPLYYRDLGTTPAEVVATSLRHPERVLAMILTPRNIGMAAILLAPFAMMPLAAPTTLLIIAPILVPLAASEHFNYRNHHNATLVPYLLLAALIATRRFAPRGGAAALLAATFVTHALIGPSPLAVRRWTPGRWDYLANPQIAGRTGHDRVLDEAVALVPRDARISASGHVVPHLSHRDVCFTFPAPPDPADIDLVLVDLVGATPPAYRPRSLVIERLRELLAEPGWSLRFARDGVFIAARGERPPPAPRPRCAAAGEAAAPVTIGPLTLTHDGGDSRWTATQPIAGPVLLLDADTREVWPGPSAPAAPVPWPQGVSVAAPCRPPAGTRLYLLELRDGFPADHGYRTTPPQPWLPEVEAGAAVVGGP